MKKTEKSSKSAPWKPTFACEIVWEMKFCTKIFYKKLKTWISAAETGNYLGVKIRIKNGKGGRDKRFLPVKNFKHKTYCKNLLSHPKWFSRQKKKPAFYLFILRSRDHKFASFWDHKITKIIISQITRSFFFSISRSRDHKLSSFWDHGIMRCLHFEITGSCVDFILRSQDHKFYSFPDHRITVFFDLDHKKQ